MLATPKQFYKNILLYLIHFQYCYFLSSNSSGTKVSSQFLPERHREKHGRSKHSLTALAWLRRLSGDSICSFRRSISLSALKMSSVQPRRALSKEHETPAEETFPEFKEIIVKSEEEVDGKLRLLDFTAIDVEKIQRRSFIWVVGRI